MARGPLGPVPSMWSTPPRRRDPVVRTCCGERGARTCCGERGARTCWGERGSQALEFALVLPAVLLLVVLVIQVAVAGTDLVVAQGLAREAARAAAVSDDTAARAATSAAAGGRTVSVSFSPPSPGRSPGDLVTARLELRSRTFALFGAPMWIPARATMRVEDS